MIAAAVWRFAQVPEWEFNMLVYDTTNPVMDSGTHTLRACMHAQCVRKMN